MKDKPGEKQPKLPDEWTCCDVYNWMKENGFENYASLFAHQHKIDGKVLLSLTENDFRERPLQINVLGDIKRLSKAIDGLRRTCGMPDLTVQVNGDVQSFHSNANHVHRHSPHSLETNGFVVKAEDIEEISKPSVPLREKSSEFLIFSIESEDTKSKSVIKTLLAAFYCSFVLLLTSFVMVIVHDRVPDMKTYPPLPDLVLDSIPLIPWAFEVCEMLACTLAIIWIMVVLFHKHRLILLRRMFSLTGTVFLLRCITMLITSLSVPGVHLECTSQSYGDVYAKMRQAFRIWYGMGMSLRGVRTCGDYMFSGHTTAVTLLNHFVTEYTPDSWHYMHTASWVMNLFSIFFILAGHEHYSIDVFVAFYISSRLFLYYHSMAYHASSMTSADSRTRIWFPLFWFFESGGQVGRVKNEYELPLPSLNSIRSVLNAVWSSKDQYSNENKQKVKFYVGNNDQKLASPSTTGEKKIKHHKSGNKSKLS